MKQLTSENLKQIIAGLPKGLNIKVDGKECSEVKIGIENEGNYFIDFLTTEKVVESSEHDGCVGCEYVYRDDMEYPCVQCKQYYRNEYVSKSK